LGTQEGTDVEANAIVDVWIPADCLLVYGLPTHKKVVGRFTFEDLFELSLEIKSGSQSIIGAIDAFGLIQLLAINPIAQISEVSCSRVLRPWPLEAASL
jgi:hypothetical protein